MYIFVSFSKKYPAGCGSQPFLRLVDSQRVRCAEKRFFLLAVFAGSVSQGDFFAHERFSLAGGCSSTHHTRAADGRRGEAAGSGGLWPSTTLPATLYLSVLGSSVLSVSKVVGRGVVGFPSGVVGRQTDIAKCQGSW